MDMEQQHRSPDESDEAMNIRKSRERHFVEQRAFEQVVGSWRPERRQLESYSVDEQEAAELLRSRWQAEVRVNVPSYFHEADRVVGDLRASLAGREPLVAHEAGVIWALFLVANANDANRNLVDRFTEGLIRELDADATYAVVSTITRFDTSDINHLLTDDYQERPTEP